jgi:hypothetical protein
LPLHGTAADRALAFPTTGRPSADDVVVRVATARSAWLHTTLSSASPPREALGCPPVASRLSHAPARPIVARLWSAHWRSSAAGRFPHTGVTIATSWLCCPTCDARCSQIPRREATGLRLHGVSQVGNAGNIPDDRPPSLPRGVAAPPNLGFVYLFNGPRTSRFAPFSASIGATCYGTTQKYITDSRDASPTAITLAQTYINATFKQRLSTLQDTSVFPGVYVLNERRHVKPVFFPKEVQIPGPPDAEEGDEEYLLVHGSNDPSTFRPELLPLDVAKVALVLVLSSGPQQACNPLLPRRRRVLRPWLRRGPPVPDGTISPHCSPGVDPHPLRS